MWVVRIEGGGAGLGGDVQVPSYEVSGKTANGKVRGARVTPEGKVLETE